MFFESKNYSTYFLSVFKLFLLKSKNQQWSFIVLVSTYIPLRVIYAWFSYRVRGLVDCA